MMKKLPICILLTLTTLPAPASDRDAEIKKIRSEIAETEKKISELKAAITSMKDRLRKLDDGAMGPGGTGRRLDIRVRRDNWGDGSREDIQAVLDSAAGEIWKYFPNRKLDPILVSYSRSDPIVLYKRGSNNEYFVKLSARDRYWCQYAYQFAHELCHILAGYTEHGPRKNKWFEESLCEAASMFVILKMSETWKTSPPYSNWKKFSAVLRKYYDALPVSGSDALPEGMSLAEWYRKNANELRNNSCIRNKNKVVAEILLELLLDTPEAWQCIGHLNTGKPDSRDSFQKYLENWHKHSPEKHRVFIRKVAALFEIRVGG